MSILETPTKITDLSEETSDRGSEVWYVPTPLIVPEVGPLESSDAETFYAERDALMLEWSKTNDAVAYALEQQRRISELLDDGQALDFAPNTRSIGRAVKLERDACLDYNEKAHERHQRAIELGLASGSLVSGEGVHESSLTRRESKLPYVQRHNASRATTHDIVAAWSKPSAPHNIVADSRLPSQPRYSPPSNQLEGPAGTSTLLAAGAVKIRAMLSGSAKKY